MFSVTVGAYWSIAHTSRNRFAVNALAICGEHVGVALTTGLGNIRPKDLRRWVAAGNNVVRAVTIGADGASLARSDRARVNAFQVGLNGANHRNAKFFGQRGIGVANSASRSDILRIHRRAGIGATDKLVNIAMTARAGRRLGKSLGARFAVDALAVGLHAVRVAILALHRLQLSLVGNFRDVGVAGGAFKDAVNGAIEGLLFDLKRDGLAIPFLLQFRAVTGEASIFCNRLRPQTRNPKQDENGHGEKK